MIKNSFADRVAAELGRARTKHPTKLNSAHEAFAVIREEVDELWDKVKADEHKSPAGQTLMVDELVQIAAMCQRAAEDVFPEALSWSVCDCCGGDMPDTGLPYCSVECHEIAEGDPSPERTVALRKLLEAKDAAVRAKLHPGG